MLAVHPQPLGGKSSSVTLIASPGSASSTKIGSATVEFAVSCWPEESTVRNSMVSLEAMESTGSLALFQPRWCLWMVWLQRSAMISSSPQMRDGGAMGRGRDRPRPAPLLRVLGVDVFVVHRNMDRLDEEDGIAADPVRMHGVAFLIHDRNPGRVLHHIVEDALPGLGALGLHRLGHHGIGGRSPLVEGGVAVPGPVPAALDRARAAQDHGIEVGGIREIGDPGEPARPDHGSRAIGSAGL